MNSNVDKELYDLCTKFIDFFTELKSNGIINEDEYEKHINLKRRFINDYNTAL
ncbi:hypothetical protein [Sporosalibacterium faouarense]|uniref:hypothetical protein n=1 Tax=Sporosalibacterium faouarense TaxID=516123 RepID=UPI00192B7AF2|nr:hypothetical protein [Sporosalibacterium faouarense]